MKIGAGMTTLGFFDFLRLHEEWNIGKKWKVGISDCWNQYLEGAVLVILLNPSSNVKSWIPLFIDLAQSMQSTMLKLVFPNSVRESKAGEETMRKLF